MLKDVIEVKTLENYQVILRFEDGVQGVADISKLVDFTGIFAPLMDRNYFIQVYVDPELGTICWPNHADIDPDVLYSVATGEPLPEFEKIYAQ